MSKKIVFRNKPQDNSFGIYTNLDDNNSTNYYDSDSLPIRYDKFIGRDLYSTSIGSNVNEVILDAKVKNNYSNPLNPLDKIDDLKLTGDSFIQINNLNIVNRGVRSRINDVFFRFFIFSKAFFNPFNADGKTLRSFSTLRSGMQGSGDLGNPAYNGAAWFYNQNGPNYGKGGSPGNFGRLQNLVIVNNFDTTNYGDAGDSSFASSPDFAYKYPTFNPIVALRKSSVITTAQSNLTAYPNGWNLDFQSNYSADTTNIFQEDFADPGSNKCFFGIHMDGDLNPKYGSDRSRDETICIYEFSPQELFDDAGGKVTTLNWDNPTAVRYSNNQSYTAAFIGRELQITINTIGGVKLISEGGDYNPPQEYIDSGIYKTIIGPLGRDVETYNDTILNMFPNREIKTIAEGVDEQGHDLDSMTEQQHHFSGIYGEYLPIPKVEVYDKDLQVYYQDKNDKAIASSPNTVELKHEISLHPSPDVGYQEMDSITQDAYDLIYETETGPAPGQYPRSLMGDGWDGIGAGVGGAPYNGDPYGLGYGFGDFYGPDDDYTWFVQELSSLDEGYQFMSTNPLYPNRYYMNDPNGYSQIRGFKIIRDLLYAGIPDGDMSAEPTPSNYAEVIGSDNAAAYGYVGTYKGPIFIKVGDEWMKIEDIEGGQWLSDSNSYRYAPIYVKVSRGQNHPVLGEPSAAYPHGAVRTHTYNTTSWTIEEVNDVFQDGAVAGPEVVEFWKFRERVVYTSDIFSNVSYVLTYDAANYFSDGSGFELQNRLDLQTSYYGQDVNLDGLIDLIFAIPNENSSQYLHFVVDWNDNIDKYQTVDSVLEDWPRTKTELLEKQNQNLFKISPIDEALKNNYLTPGMKTIKSIVFNYKDDNTLVNGLRKFPKYEPLRWKLVTTRIFLDIPVSEFPDFGEVGGDDYTTIPWPHTSPIIGGISQNSKYKKSIDDVLGGGKIGYDDIIDETFLVNSFFNDELGETIEKMDLEQTRYFDKSYDIHELLNISQFVSPGLNPYEQLTIEEFFGVPHVGNSEAIWTFVSDNSLDPNVSVPTTSDWEVYEIQTDRFGNQIGDETFFNRWNSPANGNAWDEPGKLITPGNSYKIKILLNNPIDLFNGVGVQSDPPPYIEWPADANGAMKFEHPLLLEPIEISNLGEGESYVTTIQEMGYETILKNFGHHADSPIPTLEQVGITVDDVWDSHNIYPNENGWGGPSTGLGGSPPYPMHEYALANPTDHEEHNHRIAIRMDDYEDYEGNPAGPSSPAISVERWCKLRAAYEGDFGISAQYLATVNYTISGMGGVNQLVGNQNWTNPDFGDDLSGIGNYGDGYYEYVAFYCGDNGEYCGQASPDDTTPDVDPGNGNTTTTGGSSDDDVFELPESVEDIQDPQRYKWVYHENLSGLIPTEYVTTITCQFAIPIQPLEVVTPITSGTETTLLTKFFDPTLPENNYFRPYTDRGTNGYWNFQTHATTFPQDSSVGQIFINDISNREILNSCKFELNTGNLSEKSIYDSSGKANKGLLIGDYKVKKSREGEPMRRDSFIKVPKKDNNSKGAL